MKTLSCGQGIYCGLNAEGEALCDDGERVWSLTDDTDRR